MPGFDDGNDPRSPAGSSVPVPPRVPGVAQLRYLARGGQALVFEGVHARGPCVVKVLRPDVAHDDDTLLERFAREIDALERIQHPAVVQLWGRGQLEGGPYAILERVDGQTLAEVRHGGPVRVGPALDWLAQLLDALASLHRQAIVHRDIKPANLMVSPDPALRFGRLRVLDFGVMKDARSDQWSLTHTNQVVGTMGYLPPEIVEGRPLGPALDLWGAAVCLYELVTAEPDLGGRKPGNVRPVGVPPVVAPLLERMLAPRPSDRFPSARLAGEAVAALRASMSAR